MSDDGPQVINPPNPLKAKVDVTADGVDLEALERAEQVIANMQGDYMEWVKEDLANLYKAFEAAKAESDPEQRDEQLEEVFRIAHDIKGQGGSFDFPLMTLVGNYLCRYIEKLEGPASDSHLQVIKLHIDALMLILGDQMKGDGGPTGERLIKGIEAVHAKQAQKK